MYPDVYLIQSPISGCFPHAIPQSVGKTDSKQPAAVSISNIHCLFQKSQDMNINTRRRPWWLKMITITPVEDIWAFNLCVLGWWQWLQLSTVHAGFLSNLHLQLSPSDGFYQTSPVRQISTHIVEVVSGNNSDPLCQCSHMNWYRTLQSAPISKLTKYRWTECIHMTFCSKSHSVTMPSTYLSHHLSWHQWRQWNLLPYANMTEENASDNVLF